jgi:hypothetical protein
MGHRSKRWRTATLLRLIAEHKEDIDIAHAHILANDTSYKPNSTTHKTAKALAEQRRTARAKRINTARGAYAKPYDKNWQPAEPERKRPRKWVPPLRYAKSGYRYVAGDYVKLTPRATGITQIFGTNRQQARADAKALAVRQRTRRKAKQAGRERYERVKPINAEKLKALKADKHVERARRVLA